MSFFNNVDTTATSFEAGGAFELLPEENFLAAIEEIKNETSAFDNSRFINAKWRIMKPEQYANRVFFQKVRVYDADQSKADRAKQMLSAMAVNAGGKLFSEMQSRSETEPSDQSLASMTMRPMVVKLGIWKMEAKDTNDGKERSGNYVQAVSAPKQQHAPMQPPAPKPATQPAPSTQAAPADVTFDSDIPFASPYAGRKALIA